MAHKSLAQHTKIELIALLEKSLRTLEVAFQSLKEAGLQGKVTEQITQEIYGIQSKKGMAVLSEIVQAAGLILTAKGNHWVAEYQGEVICTDSSEIDVLVKAIKFLGEKK